MIAKLELKTCRPRGEEIKFGPQVVRSPLNVVFPSLDRPGADAILVVDSASPLFRREERSPADMDGTDADGEWSDEELLRSGSQTGVSDDQDTGLSSGQDKKKTHKISGNTRQEDKSPASGTELRRPRHKNHHHRPSLGSLIKKISTSSAPDPGEQLAQAACWDNTEDSCTRSPEVTSFSPSAAVKTSSNLKTYSGLGKTSGSSRMMSAPDPVSAILDKIDAQIDAMDATDMSVVPKLTNGDRKSSRLTKQGPSRLKSDHSGLITSGDAGVGGLHDSEFSDAERSKVIAAPAEIFSEANLTDGFTDDERARRLDSDIPSDLDSVAAQQIDIKFKEIMRKKKDFPDEAAEEMAKIVRHILRRNSTWSADLDRSPHHLGGAVATRSRSAEDGVKGGSRISRRDSHIPPDLPLPPSSGKKASSCRGAAAAASQLGSKLRSRSASRPSATMLSTGYGTDNDSVRTEEFETKFMSLMVGGGQGGVSDSDGGRSKPETPRRRPNSVPPDTSKVTLNPPQPQLQPQLQQPVPGLAKEDEELLQKLVRVANETRRSSSPAQPAPLPAPAPIISRPRSVSPTRLRSETDKIYLVRVPVGGY
ncbi:hypothetical protein RRG08_054253 [Elysia crispata]|uniref:Uncharacterized protein n=1 Tax=Elysia crispata TaxID=231223 RepID=A0AAE1CWQ3_9GAST|nr:hypothetical protein RRG08_054253 [Elysia crispata]